MGTTRLVRWLGIAVVVLGGTVAGAQTGGTEVLLQRLEQLAGEYAPGGTMAGVARTGTLGEGQEKRIGLHLEAGKCYVFIGVGDGELADLDMALESEGTRLGEDTQPDNYPVVRACSPIAVRVEIVLTATRGTGSYVLGQFDVPPAGDAVEAAQAAPTSDALAARLDALAAEKAPGAAIDGELFRARMLEDEVSAVSRRMRGGTCYLFVAVAGDGAQDLDMAITVGPQNAGQDNGTGVEAVVGEFCPAQDATATVRLTMTRGSGDVRFAAYARAATGALTQIATVDTVFLTRRLAERAATGATGMNPAQTPQFGSLAEGLSANISFEMRSGQCYRAVAVSESSITNLDLDFYVDGSPVAEDNDAAASAVVGTCAAADGVARVDIWAVTGSGGYAIGIYSGAQPASAATTAASTNPLFTMLDAAAVALAPGATRASEPFTGALTVAGTQQYDVSLQSGKCYAFVGIADSGNLDLELTSGVSVIGRDNDLDTTPGVLYCATSAMTVRAKLTLLSASGNFAFGVYNAPSVQSSTSTPRVTSTGIAVGGTETDYIANQIRLSHEQVASALLPVSQVNRGTLQQAEESEFLVNLPAGRCYTIVTAGVPSVRDLDVTLTSPYGQVLATDSTDDASPVLVTNPCPQWSGDYRIKILMQYGYGAFGFQVFSQ
ncbi:MAG: hypothetical protein HY905_10595 [Deltaproteobacteria bacterium]|nr:hypothetical protein [Deltaproteobacteria bacterium]